MDEETKVDEQTRGRLAERCDKLNLIGVYLMPDATWVVTDGRRSSNNEFQCCSKGGVLEKIADLLETMHPTILDGNDEMEVTLLVTTQVSNDGGDLPALNELRSSVKEAIQHAVNYGEMNGFVHPLAEYISIGVSSVDTLCIE